MTAVDASSHPASTSTGAAIIQWGFGSSQNDQWLPKEIAGTDVGYDEDGRSYVKADTPRMYNLIGKQPYGAYEIRLYVKGKGLSLYSFSFGTCEMPQDRVTIRSAKEGT